LEDDEWMIFILSAIAAVLAHWVTGAYRLHPLVVRGNPYPGLARVGTLGGMGFVAYVLARFADESVTGIYVAFYLVMAYALILWVGRGLGGAFGARYRVDVCERRNPASGLFLSAMMLAIGVLFGSCLWGEADPYSDDEGGYWIPLGFFVMGILVYAAAMFLYARREPGGLKRALIADRSVPAARAAATYALSLAWIVSGALAGDFFGWFHGFAAVGQVVVLLVLHELFRLVGKQARRGGRLVESAFYLAIGFGLPQVLALIPGWSDI
jgi:hypothetical protein